MVEDLGVDRLHSLRIELAGVFDFLLADFAPARLDRRIVDVCGPAMQHVARPDGGLESRRVVAMRRVFHRIEVVQVAEEFVETVDRGQKRISVTQMVLAKLARGIAHRLQRGGDGRRFCGHSQRRAGLAHGGQARADRQLAGNEVGPAGRAARLGVVVGEHHPFMGETVEIGSLAGHHATVVGANVKPADVVAHDEDDVRLLARGGFLHSSVVGQSNELRLRRPLRATRVGGCPDAPLGFWDCVEWRRDWRTNRGGLGHALWGRRGVGIAGYAQPG